MSDGAIAEPAMPEPVPPRITCQKEVHGISWEDPFCGLRDAAYPEISEPTIVDYIAAENSYYGDYFERRQELVDKLYGEFLSHISWSSETPLIKSGPYYYYSRWGSRLSYVQYLRRHIKTGVEELLLDSGERAKEFGQINVQSFRHSPDHRLVAWAEDIDGSEHFTIRVRRVGDADMLPEAVAGSSGKIYWAANSEGFFYVELNQSGRAAMVRFHRLGTAVNADPILFVESDSQFLITIRVTQSGHYLLIECDGLTSTETWLVPTSDPTAAPTLVVKRREGHEYFVDEAGGSLYIRTNDKHFNFRIVRTPVATPGPEFWLELVSARKNLFIDRAVAFKSFLLMQVREDGVEHIRVNFYRGGYYDVSFQEEYRTARISETLEYDTNLVNLRYESMLRPPSILAYRVDRRRVQADYSWAEFGDYDPGKYRSKRLYATARDGTRIPISILFPKDFMEQAEKRLFLYAYGAYGATVSPYFSPYRLSLLDRGFAYAIVHVRGGGALGPAWHAAGAGLKRRNTYEDFIDAADFLVEKGYAREGQIAISGLSAGAMITGYVLNEAPEKWRVAVLQSPFLDVLNTMLDPGLQLTPVEWKQWGNPLEDREVFEYIRSYSPYENIRRQAYPAVMVTSGLNDRRVTYWEPLKWVARLRTSRHGPSPVLLELSTADAHSGRSAFEDNLLRQAQVGTFILQAFGLEK